jgi:hypothetical protein
VKTDPLHGFRLHSPNPYWYWDRVPIAYRSFREHFVQCQLCVEKMCSAGIRLWNAYLRAAYGDDFIPYPHRSVKKLSELNVV